MTKTFIADKTTLDSVKADTSLLTGKGKISRIVSGSSNATTNSELLNITGKGVLNGLGGSIGFGGNSTEHSWRGLSVTIIADGITILNNVPLFYVQGAGGTASGYGIPTSIKFEANLTILYNVSTSINAIPRLTASYTLD